MKVKLLTSRSSPEGCNGPGDIINVGAAEAARLLQSGQAEAVEPKPKTRTAAKRTAAKRTARPKKTEAK